MAIFLSLLFSLHLQSFAQEQKKEPLISTAKTHVCHSDWQKNCKNAEEPTKENRYGCLIVKHAQLSKKCQDFVTAKTSGIPCVRDAITMCKGVAPTVRNLIACMTPQAKYANAACRAYLEKNKSIREKDFSERDSICKADREKYCGGMTPHEQYGCMIATHRKNLLTRPCHDYLKKNVGVLRRGE